MRFARPSSGVSLILATAMFLAPTATLQAQKPAGNQANLKYVTENAAIVLLARPQQVMTSPVTEMLPVEVATAAGVKYLGIDPADVTEVVVVAEPPMAGPPEFAIIVKLSKAMSLDQLPENLRGHTEEGQAGGKTYYKSMRPDLPSFFMPNDKTLVVATQNMLKRLFSGGDESTEGRLAEQLKARTGGDDIYLAVDLEKLRPFIQMGLMQAAQNMPPEAQEFLQGVNLIGMGELALNITTSQPNELIFHANNAADADELEELVDKAVVMAQDGMLQAAAQLKGSDDEVEQALGSYIERISGKIYEPMKPQRDGEKFTVISAELDVESPGGQIVAVYVIGVLVALLLPAVQAARAAARRNAAMNNMKQLLLGMLNFESAFGKLPAHAIYSDEGQPLLSWRVQILPFIEDQGLYEQFHLDEPWDSEHNKKLIAKMPAVFSSPQSGLDISEGKSNYLGVQGEKMLFDGTQNGAQFRTITDGTSNTIALVEVDDAAAEIWTKPADWEFDAEDPTKGLGGLHPGAIFNAGYCDGHVEAVSVMIEVETLKAMFTKNGGEVINQW